MPKPQTEPSKTFAAIDYWAALRWSMLALLFMAMVNSYIDRGNISYAIGIMADEIGFDNKDRGWVFSVFLLSYAIMQIPAGRFVDRFGIKWSYTIAFLLWGLVAASFGAVETLWHLLALRFMLGIFESISSPASVAFIAKYFSPSQRGLATGILMSGTKIGPAIGAVLAVYLIDSFGWRLLFILCGLIPLTWIIPWLIGYKKIEDYENNSSSSTSIKDLESLEGDSRSIIPLRYLLSSRKTWGIYLGYFCYGYTWYLYINWFPSYLQEAHGMSLKEAGWWSGFSYGVLALVTVVSGFISDQFMRHGFSKMRHGLAVYGGGILAVLALASFLLTAVELGQFNLGSLLQYTGCGVLLYLILILITTAAANKLHKKGCDMNVVRICFVVTGFLLGSLIMPVSFIENIFTIKVLLLIAISGAGFATANAWAITQTIAPPSSVGTMSGIQNFGATSGGFLGPLATGYLVDATDSYATALVLAGLLMLGGIFSYIFLVGNLEPIPAPEKN